MINPSDSIAYKSATIAIDRAVELYIHQRQAGMDDEESFATCFLSLDDHIRDFSAEIVCALISVGIQKLAKIKLDMDKLKESEVTREE